MLDFQQAITARNRLDSLYTRLKSDRSSFDQHWRDLADYFYPRRTRWFTGDRNRGDRRNQHIINSSGLFAARTLESGMHAGLTSPARPWMKLTLVDREAMENVAVRQWLQTVTNMMLRMFAVSNLYNALPTVYGDMGVFATGCMAILEDEQDVFRTYTYPMGSYVLGRDSRGMVTMFGREFELSVIQVVERYAVKADGRSIDWSVLSDQVKRCWERGDYETAIPVRWMIIPNPEYDKNLLPSRYKKFASKHWEVGSSEPTFLRESGFDSMPVMAPRWAITEGDDYGTDCPGMTALGDNKQLQSMERTGAKGLQKIVDPALVGPTSLRTQKTSILPGDITYADTREGMAGLRAVHEVRLSLQELGMSIQAVEYRIKRAFFEDLFLMLAVSDPYRGAGVPTAREIDERHEEKLLALGPVLERTNDELLDPVVDRVFDLMQAEGFFPPPPPQIQGKAMKPEYISILSQAQQMVGIVAIDRLLSMVVPVAQTFPQITTKLKPEVLVDEYASMLGVDSKAIRSEEETARIQAAQEQAAREQAQAEQAQKLGAGIKSASEAQLGGDSALDRIVGNAANVGPADQVAQALAPTGPTQ